MEKIKFIAFYGKIGKSYNANKLKDSLEKEGIEYESFDGTYSQCINLYNKWNKEGRIKTFVVTIQSEDWLTPSVINRNLDINWIYCDYKN